MNIYCVYIDARKNQPETIIIKQGFSILAAFFNIFWTLYHRMWLISLLLLITSVIASPLEKIGLYYLYDIVILFLMGFLASDIREHYLLKRGYELSEIIVAENEEDAELKYYQKLQQSGIVT